MPLKITRPSNSFKEYHYADLAEILDALQVEQVVFVQVDEFETADMLTELDEDVRKVFGCASSEELQPKSMNSIPMMQRYRSILVDPERGNRPNLRHRTR